MKFRARQGHACSDSAPGADRRRLALAGMMWLIYMVNVRTHLLVPALAVLIAAFTMGALLYLYQPKPASAPAAPKNPLVRPQPRTSAFGWTLVKAASAHTAMVLEVETSRPWEAVAIAQQLTGPYKDRFDEVLIFFFVPEAEPRVAVRRVQWTRANGYQTLELRPAQ